MSAEELDLARPSFIRESQVKDKNGRRPSDPGYDETTLYIPDSAWATFTPCMTQYW